MNSFVVKGFLQFLPGCPRKGVMLFARTYTMMTPSRPSSVTPGRLATCNDSQWLENNKCYVIFVWRRISGPFFLKNFFLNSYLSEHLLFSSISE